MIAVALVAVGSWAFAQYRRVGFYYVKGWWEAETATRGWAVAHLARRTEQRAAGRGCQPRRARWRLRKSRVRRRERRDRRRVRLLFGSGGSDLFWGPPGSRFAVIRSISGTTEHYEAFDLTNGCSLREETWYDGRLRGDRTPPDVAPGVDPYDDDVERTERSKPPNGFHPGSEDRSHAIQRSARSIRRARACIRAARDAGASGRSRRASNSLMTRPVFPEVPSPLR